jgi:hypothetical protein
LCHSCAAVYKHNPRYLTDLDLGDDEMSEMADERWEQTKVPGPALSPEVLESLQRQVDAKLGNTSTQRPTPTVDDIMAKIRRKQEKKALIESVAEPAPDESPVVVSNNEGARKEPAESYSSLVLDRKLSKKVLDFPRFKCYAELMLEIKQCLRQIGREPNLGIVCPNSGAKTRTQSSSKRSQ